MPKPPTSDADLFSDEIIRNPYPLYKQLRDLGSVVWMEKHDAWAITRYEEVKYALKTWEIFSSAKGVAMDPDVNSRTSGPKANSLTTDRPLHDIIRRVTSAPLLPGALKDIRPAVESLAEKTIKDLCERASFDGMKDLAQVLPLNIVSELVGLPQYGRESMLRWAAATFNAMGPMNERGREAVEELKEMHEFCAAEAVPGKLRPGSWAERIYTVVSEHDEISEERCQSMLREYIGPSLDTTIFATGHLLRLLGENQDQWGILRNDRTLVHAAIDEALRVETPVRHFTRYVSQDVTLGGVEIPAGSRVLVMYASGNRDERKWEDPDVFRIKRKPVDHLAFGHGVHTCAGMHLARLEISSLVNAMIDNVGRIEIGEPEVFFNNTLGGLAALPMKFVKAENTPEAATE